MGKRRVIPDDAGRDQAARVPTTAARDIPSPHEEDGRRTAKLRQISLAGLQPHSLQPPERHAVDRVMELAESIRAQGLLQPPLISQQDDGAFVILAGHRRVTACRVLEVEGAHPGRIPAYVLTGLSEEEELSRIAAELHHRDDRHSPVALAEIVGRIATIRSDALGRRVSGRDLADVVPWAKHTAVARYRRVYEALQDLRLEPLVRAADKAGIGWLDKALGLDEFSLVERALEAFAHGGKRAMAEVVAAQGMKKGGRPLQVVRRTTFATGYDLTFRVRESMPEEDARKALDAVGELEAALRERLEAAGGDAARDG